VNSINHEVSTVSIGETMRSIVRIGIVLCLCMFSQVLFAGDSGAELSETVDQLKVLLSSSDTSKDIIKLIKKKPELLTYKSATGEDLVFMAANNTEVLGYLVEKGMKLAVVDNNGNTPLHTLHTSVYTQKNPKSIEDAIIMFRTAGVDLNACNKDGVTALYNASRLGRTAIAECLIRHGATLDILSAVELGDSWIISSILSTDSGAINVVDNRGMTPLHLVVEKKSDSQKEIVAQLLKNGADVNKKDKTGRTPLFYAVEKQCYEVIGMLLESGANVMITDDSGDTPLHAAVRAGDSKAAQLLIDHGADVNAKNGTGQTPVNYAVVYEKPALNALLREHGARQE
jgi:ankyrin repeat protein